MCAKTMLNKEKTQVQMSYFIPNAVSLLSVMSNTVDMIRVEKINTFHNLYERTSCLDSTDRVVEWKMHLISLLGTATKLSNRTSGQVVSIRQTEFSSGNSFYANRREGTSALHTVYASFYKQ